MADLLTIDCKSAGNSNFMADQTHWGFLRYVVHETLHLSMRWIRCSGFHCWTQQHPKGQDAFSFVVFSEPVFDAFWLCCLKRHGEHRSYCGVSESTEHVSRRGLGCSTKVITMTEDVAQLGECSPGVQEVLVTLWLHGEFEASLTP